MAEEGYEARLAASRHDLDRLTRRLRGLTTASWRTRAEVVLTGLRTLAELDAAAELVSPPALPALPSHALADATAVIGTDLLRALAVAPNVDLLGKSAETLAALLAATR